ncbi:MAG TPA: PAC2 family protein [Smithellaceae bacterium]|nr:PAC2 family protein [Smithellaceae bacterium]HRV25949.1 PAC2 family protein [Smithellaceae bacterium]
MNDSLIFQDKPDLVNPYLLIGLNGWLNAGEVATGCIDFLRRNLNAQKFAHIDSLPFHVWQVPGFDLAQAMRPHAVIEEGVVKSLAEPASEFFYWKSGAEHDLILYTGFEPNLRWPEYASAILSIAKHYRAPRIYSLGGVYDQVPHTRETSVFAVLSRPEMKSEFKSFPLLNYAGPCSFSTMLLSQAGKEGIEAAGITARVPPYIQVFNAKACYDLLKKVFALTPLNIDLSDLKKSGDNLVEMMNKSFSQNDIALKQLQKLEEMYDAALLQEYGQAPGLNIDELMQEMLNMKKDDKKLH